MPGSNGRGPAPGHPIAANQVHYNLAVREAELSGLTDYCVEHDIMLIAWRPLQKGTLDAEAPELLREIARRHGRTPAQIALAWLAAQPNTVTISTMRDRRHQLLNCEALEFTLPAEELLRLSREFPARKPYPGPFRSVNPIRPAGSGGCFRSGKNVLFFASGFTSEAD